MDKQTLVNSSNMAGFLLYVVGRVANLSWLCIVGITLVVISMITTIIYRKKFDKSQFWLAALFLILLIILVIIRLLR
jgi:hypothetical protein